MGPYHVATSGSTAHGSCNSLWSKAGAKNGRSIQSHAGHEVHMIAITDRYEKLETGSYYTKGARANELQDLLSRNNRPDGQDE